MDPSYMRCRLIYQQRLDQRSILFGRGSVGQAIVARAVVVAYYPHMKALLGLYLEVES